MMAPALMLVLSAAMFLCSCASTANFDYAGAEGAMLRMPPLPQKPTITVLPFQDRRHQRNLQPAGTTAPPALLQQERGSLHLGWIPLAPYGWIAKPSPELQGGSTLATLQNYWCLFSRELAEAAAASLEYSGLFQKVETASTPSAAQSDWLFKGYYTNTDYHGYRLAYGLTYLGAAPLWAVGFPCAISTNHLTVTFQITHRQSGEVLWQMDFDRQKRIVHWIYTPPGSDADGYPELMKMAMNTAIYEIDRHFRKEPPPVDQPASDGFLLPNP